MHCPGCPGPVPGFLSPYLEEALTDARLQYMRRRIADECLQFDGERVWPEDSDYHLLPDSERREVEALLSSTPADHRVED